MSGRRITGELGGLSHGVVPQSNSVVLDEGPGGLLNPDEKYDESDCTSL